MRRSARVDGSATATLKLRIEAPASIVSTVAAATSSTDAVGTWPRAERASRKIGRISNVQSGQIAGAPESRAPTSAPATSVPCLHASLLALLHALAISVETLRTAAAVR